MADIRINALANTATSAASDDYLALDGSANGTRKILATNVAQNVTDVTLGSAGPSVKSSLSARAPRQGLVFDGTDDVTLSGPTLGLNDFTISFVSSLPSISGIQSILSGISGPLIQNNAGALTFYKQGGSLLAYIAGVFEAGKSALITLTRSGTSVIVYKNGIQFSTATLPSNTDFSGSVAFFGSADGTNEKLTGTVTSPLIYNRALSASEVVALYEAGAPAGADYNSASNTASYTSDFSAGTDGWTDNTGGQCILTGNVDGVAGVNDTLQISKGTTGVFQITRLALNATAQVGALYRLEFDYYADASCGIPYFSIGIWGGANYVVGSNLAVVEGSWQTSKSLTFRTITTGINFYASNVSTGIGGAALATGKNVYLKNVRLVRLGLLLAPDAAQAGGGYVWNDQSGNLAQIVLPPSGVQWALPSVAGQRIRGTTSTNGNQQLLGASVLLPAECQITHVRARARTGTPTITIGTASGGAQIVASVALSTTWLNCTIALTGGIVSSADDIWVGSNSTDVVETDIAFQPLDF